MAGGANAAHIRGRRVATVRDQLGLCKEQAQSRVLLLGMLFIFITGVSLPHAFGDQATLLSCSYAVVRLLPLALYAHASRRGSASWSAIADLIVAVGLVCW